MVPIQRRTSSNARLRSLASLSSIVLKSRDFVIGSNLAWRLDKFLYLQKKGMLNLLLLSLSFGILLPSGVRAATLKGEHFIGRGKGLFGKRQNAL